MGMLVDVSDDHWGGWLLLQNRRTLSCLGMLRNDHVRHSFNQERVINGQLVQLLWD